MKHARIIHWIKDGKIEKVTKKISGKWKTVELPKAKNHSKKH